MPKFSVLILGSASAAPILDRGHTSQLVNIDEKYYLVDCGEGTQLRLRQHKIKLQRIHHIFISHLHGDHYLGLIGLLQTMNLLGRVSGLSIYCPDAIEEIIQVHLKFSKNRLNYPIEYVKVNSKTPEKVYEDEKLEISSIPLKHRIPCVGYLFREKAKPRRIKADEVKKYNVPKHFMNRLKLGEDFTISDEKIIKNEKLTDHPHPSYSYAFCSDTSYNEEILNQIKGADLLYHEATFSKEHEGRAAKTFHSTAEQAALIACKSGVKKLIIGHFSNRYTDLNVILKEARSVFENTDLALQGVEFEIAETQ